MPRLSVKYKFAVVIGLMTGVHLLGLWQQTRIDRANRTVVMHGAETEHTRLLEQLIVLKGDPLRVFVSDYSPWDDMIHFATHPDPEWAQINLYEALKTYQLDAAWVLATDGSLIYSIPANDREDLRPLPLSAAAVQDLIKRQGQSHFYTLSPRGLLEMRCAPIRGSAEIADFTKPRAWLFAARWWDAGYINDLAQLSACTLRLAEPGEEISPASDMEVVTQRILPDWQRRPLRILVARFSPPAMGTMERDSQQDLLLFVGFGLMLIVAVLVAINQWVLRPLARIGQSLDTRDIGPVRHLLGNRDEFGRLSRAVERFFAQDGELRQVFEAFNAIDDAVLIAESDTHRLIYANAGATRLLGKSHEELRSQRLDRLLPAAANAHPSGSALPTGQILGTGGRLIEVEFRQQTLRSPSGKDLYVVVMRDITARRQMEKERLRAQRMESLGALAGGVAHDLNNVLTPVSLFLSELEDPHSRPDPKLVAGVRVSVRRSAEMLRQLLTFGRGIEGERRPVDVAGLFEEMMRIIASTFPKNLHSSHHLPDDLWPVIGDPTQLNQVLLNLCVNARDAMPGGGSLNLSASNRVLSAADRAHWQDVPPGRYVLIEVSDTGTGIPPEVLDRIFEPFFSTKPAAVGTGLGLSTTLGIVRGHGGAITVASEPGRGTCFRLLLPAADTAQTAAKPAAAACAGANRTILVVEDEAYIRQILVAMLGRMGFRTVEAEDGNSALQQVGGHNPSFDLVITDLSMNGMGGVELVRRLRATHPRIRIIVMSGRIDEEARHELDRLGISGIVNKPFTREELSAALNQCLG